MPGDKIPGVGIQVEEGVEPPTALMFQAGNHEIIILLDPAARKRIVEMLTGVVIP